MLRTTTALISGLSLFAAALPAAAQDQALIVAAKAEGTVTTIALPHDWCNYGGVIEGFKAKYGIEVNELNPDAGSADELEAVRANKDNMGPQAPDVLDVGFSFGPAAKDEGLIQPYKVSTWDDIPDNVKDPEGYWYGDYYGVLSFAVNKDLVPEPPADWTRATVVGCHCKHCAEANAFLAAPDQERWTLRAVEHSRRHVQQQLQSGGADVDFATVKKGSPHRLVCTKNQRSYERRRAQYAADLAALARLEADTR